MRGDLVSADGFWFRGPREADYMNSAHDIKRPRTVYSMSIEATATLGFDYSLMCAALEEQRISRPDGYTMPPSIWAWMLGYALSGYRPDYDESDCEDIRFLGLNSMRSIAARDAWLFHLDQEDKRDD